MKHVMLDCYGANERQLDDVKLINEVLNRLVYKLQIKPIEPPHLLPYYYGSVKEDIGVSGKLLLLGGHVTIHTFPLRTCYFVDIFYDGEFSEEDVIEFFSNELPYNKNTSNVEVRNRDINSFDMVEYSSDNDFGPHVLLDLEATNTPNMETFFDFLENLVTRINMDPISRATVLKSSPVNPKYLSAIIVIAQSHIALHYNYETQKIYADIFSCAPFNYSEMDLEFGSLGKVISNELVVRGSKHIDKVRSIKEEDLTECYTYWQRVINKR